MVKPEHDQALISFIIPAFNEENCIRDSIRAIKDNSPTHSYQIVVVDNGSTDRTSEIVRSENVSLVRISKCTVASARNKGVTVSKGKILVFIDADVLLTRAWKDEMKKTVDRLLRNPLHITGSRCNVADERNWISRFWFVRMSYEKPNYINSGHLITTSKLFQDIGGFNSVLNTAEDYDFCMRAKKIGAQIVNNPKLYAIHTGYPTTLINFIARERWHGSGDFSNLNNILNSKVALVSIMNIVLISALLILAIIKKNILYALSYFILMYLFSVISTMLKFGFVSLTMLLTTSLIFFFYYLGRSLTVVDILKRIFSFRT